MFSSGIFPFATFILSHFVKTKVTGICNPQNLDLIQYPTTITLQTKHKKASYVIASKPICTIEVNPLRWNTCINEKQDSHQSISI